MNVYLVFFGLVFLPRVCLSGDYAVLRRINGKFGGIGVFGKSEVLELAKMVKMVSPDGSEFSPLVKKGTIRPDVKEKLQLIRRLNREGILTGKHLKLLSDLSGFPGIAYGQFGLNLAAHLKREGRPTPSEADVEKFLVPLKNHGLVERDLQGVIESNDGNWDIEAHTSEAIKLFLDRKKPHIFVNSKFI